MVGARKPTSSQELDSSSNLCTAPYTSEPLHPEELGRCQGTDTVLRASEHLSLRIIIALLLLLFLSWNSDTFRAPMVSHSRDIRPQDLRFSHLELQVLLELCLQAAAQLSCGLDSTSKRGKVFLNMIG